MNSSKRILLPFFVLLVILIGLGACSTKPKGILSPDKMEQVLYDYHIARGLSDQEKYENRFKFPLYMEDVLSKNGVTMAQFDSSMVWYTRKMPEFSKIYKNVSTRLEKDKKLLDSLVVARYETKQEVLPGDTVDMWMWKRVLKLTGSKLNNYFYYEIKGNENFVKGDHYTLRFRTKYLKHGEDSTGVQWFGTALVYYSLNEGGSHIQRVSLDRDSLYKIEFNPDTTIRAKKIEGFFYLPPQNGRYTLLLDSLEFLKIHLNHVDVVEVVDSLDVKNDSIKVDSLATDGQN